MYRFQIKMKKCRHLIIILIQMIENLTPFKKYNNNRFADLTKL